MSVTQNSTRGEKPLYIFSTTIIIIGILSIFTISFFGIQNRIETTSLQKQGVLIVDQAYKIVLNIQRLRGLKSIRNQDQATLQEIERIKSELQKDCNRLATTLDICSGALEAKEELLSYLNKISNCDFDNYTLKLFNAAIEHFIELNKKIAYASKLTLAEETKDFVLVDNVIFIFPQLIENNARIRAATLRLNEQNRHEVLRDIIIHRSNIEKKLDALLFNSNILENIDSHNDARSHRYQLMIEAQNKILQLTSSVADDGINTKSEFDLYKRITSNIDTIDELYRLDLNTLKSNQSQKLKLKQLKQIYIFISTALLIFIVLFINRHMYNKTRRYIDTIEKLTVTDSLTGLLNRRSFDESIIYKASVAERTRSTIVFLMIDIDFFKQYNDAYGHQMGDEVLKSVSHSLKSNLKRASDSAFRLGGEEFGVIAVGMNEDEAISFANKLVKSTEELCIEHKASEVSKYVTISIGVVVATPKMQCCVDCLYKDADKALYRAKQSGRNQAVLFSSTFGD